MDVRRAYCSAVDRSVPVVLKEGVPVRQRLEVSDPAAMRCLDFPARCTGWCCPLDAARDARVLETESTSPAVFDEPGSAGSPPAHNRPRQ